MEQQVGKKRRIKMVGLDLDGTLLDSKKNLTEYTKSVLRRAVDAGIIVLVATGRPFTGVPKELRDFKGMRYALTSNGARVLDVKESKVLIEHLLPMESAKKALEIFRKYDTLQEVYFDGQGYAERSKLEKIEKYHHNPHMWEYVLSSRIAIDDVQTTVEMERRNLDKVQALFADMEEREQAWRDLEEFPELELVGSLGYNIEINAAGVNKGKALVTLGELLGIAREEIMAVGDGDNDIVMLKEAGFGVAMGNAEEKVRDAADYITVSNDEDGAAKAIEQFALEGGEEC